jgi:hypothetical protein
MKAVVGDTTRLGWKTNPDEEHDQSGKEFPENLIYPLPIAKTSGFGDPLSRSLVHAGAQDGEDYGGGARSERQNLDWFWCVCGGSWARFYIGVAEEKL